MDYVPYVWLILGAAFIIAEVFTPGFVLLWFGVGALLGGVLGFVGLGIGWQILAFLTSSLGLTLASRTIFERFFSHKTGAPTLRTGVDSLPGQVGMVVEASHGALNEAAVKVYGSTWTAYPAPGEDPLQEGEKVEVDRVDGAVLYVRRASPDSLWRQDGLERMS
jgi:membrane protein implicated in regulation of membrane protease activity